MNGQEFNGFVRSSHISLVFWTTRHGLASALLELSLADDGSSARRQVGSNFDGPVEVLSDINNGNDSCLMSTLDL